VGFVARFLASRQARACAGALAVAALLAPFPGGAQRRLPALDAERPRIKFVDSLTSLNDRCMVRKVKLNPRVRPIYVNWQPVGFC
jgi:hypothetical protein